MFWERGTRERLGEGLREARPDRGIGTGVTIPQLLTWPCRNSFDAVLEVAERLCARLREAGPDQAVDIDGALQCQAFDVIGRVGFRHDYNATADLSGPGAAGCRTIKEGGRKAPVEAEQRHHHADAPVCQQEQGEGGAEHAGEALYSQAKALRQDLQGAMQGTGRHDTPSAEIWHAAQAAP